MPNLDSIPIPKYQPLQPYHWDFDNLPINGIEDQMFVVNAQVDNNQNQIESSVGSAGSLGNRLDQSLEASGALKTIAVDEALHSIAEHMDEGEFVRMTDDERSKLSLVDSSATNLSIQVETISTTIVWPDAGTTFNLADSDTIAWRVDSGDVFADTTFAKSLITVKSYDVTPVNVSSNIIWKTSSSNTAYTAGTLRVYINGLRITKSPTMVGGFYYTETAPATGRFTFNKATTTSDVLRIDFDRPIT